MKAGFFTLRHDTQLKDRMSMAGGRGNSHKKAQKSQKEPGNPEDFLKSLSEPSKLLPCWATPTKLF